MSFRFWVLLPLVVPLLTVALMVLRRRGYQWARLLCIALFASYLVMVASYTFFPIRVDEEFVLTMRVEGAAQPWFNLVPFHGLLDDGQTLRQALGNVLLGVPCGFLLPFVLNRSGITVVAGVAVFAAGIEAVQLAMNVVYGFAYRLVDVNDLILNSLGGMLGYVAFWVLAQVYRRAGDEAPADRTSYLHGVLFRR